MCTIRLLIVSIVTIFTVSSGASSPAQAQLLASVHRDVSLTAIPRIDAPVFVELFTSQSCSSCPPAEALFVDIAERDDVVAIEWHVDYWNELTLARAGNWRDPFSSAQNTDRQRAYNARIRGRNGVYTPQSVINGRLETVGSRGAEINAMIDAERQRFSTTAALTVGETGKALNVTATAPDDTDADVYVISFLERMDTDVRGGENKGLALTEAHVATGIRKYATLTAGSNINIDVPMPEGETNCAVILQAPDTGTVLAARYCR